MDRYHIVKKMSKLLNKLALYLQGTIIPENELKRIVHEIEGLLLLLKSLSKKQQVPNELLSRVEKFINAFKYHTGMEEANDRGSMNADELKMFLSEELGIEVNKDYLFRVNRNGKPLHLLFI